MKKFTLRLPMDLYEQIVASAAANQRSIHGQILWLLRNALDKKALN